MSDSIQTPEAPESAAAPQPATAATPSKVSPAQDLRDIQMLLVGGIYPGNMAPMVVKAYNMLDQMAKTVEASVEPK